MTDVFFDLLVETKTNEYILSKIISNYCKIYIIPLNTTQILLLHFLIKIYKGTARMIELEDEMSYISPNQGYNVSGLVIQGYVTKKNGSELGQDGRCEFLFVSKEGIKLYEDICEHVRVKVSRLEEIVNLGWTPERSNRYLEDSRALHYIGSR